MTLNSKPRPKYHNRAYHGNLDQVTESPKVNQTASSTKSQIFVSQNGVHKAQGLMYPAKVSKNNRKSLRGLAVTAQGHSSNLSDTRYSTYMGCGVSRKAGPNFLEVAYICVAGIQPKS